MLGGTINVESEQNENKIIAKCIGSVDALNADDFSEMVMPLAEKCNELVLDFAELEYISSAGLRVLVNTQKEMTKKSGSFKLINLNEFVDEILRLTGFTSIIDIE